MAVREAGKPAMISMPALLTLQAGNMSEASTHSRAHPPKLKAEGATSDSMNSISGHLSDTLSLAGTVSRTPQ